MSVMRPRLLVPFSVSRPRLARLGAALALMLAIAGIRLEPLASAAPLGAQVTYERMTDQAIDVGMYTDGFPARVGADGTVAFWNGQNWRDMDFQQDAGATPRRIAIGPGRPNTWWVVTEDGKLFMATGPGWTEQAIGVVAQDVGFGGGQLWLTTADDAIGRWDNGAFQAIEGMAKRIAVAPDGAPWVVNGAGAIFRRVNNVWQQLPGLAQDIGVGANGDVWVTGPDDSIQKWTGTGWERSDGAGSQIAVGDAGNPIVVTRGNEIMRATAVGAAAAPVPTPVPVTNPAQTGGVRSWPSVNILCTFADAPQTPGSKEIVQDMFMGQGGLDQYVQEMSMGQANLAGTRTVGWYTLPKPLAGYKTGSWWGAGAESEQLSDDCIAAAANDVNFPDFSLITMSFNGLIGTSGATTPVTLDRNGVTKEYRRIWLNNRGWNSPSLWAHEFGHIVGGVHNDNGYDPLGVGSYGRRFFPGPNADLNPDRGGIQGFTSYTRDKAGWIPATRKFTYGGQTQQIALARLTQPGPEGFMMAVIPLGAGGQLYTVEFRARVGFDNMPTFISRFPAGAGGPLMPADSVVIQKFDPSVSADAKPLTLVKASPTADWMSDDARWTAGKTFTDAANNVSVRVDGMDANQATLTIGPAVR